MKITIPFKTPTVNQLYWHRGNIKIMKKEAKELRVQIDELINTKIYDYEVQHLMDKPLLVLAEIHENWLTKDGRVKKMDIMNREKFLIDSVFNALGYNDKFIFECKWTKIQSKTCEKAVITLREYDKANFEE